MPSVLNALWIFVISFVLDKTCRAHECFQCRSDEDEHCADLKPPKAYKKACSESSDGYCRKSTFTLYFMGQRGPVILRECVNLRLDTLTTGESCYFGKYTRDSNSLTCECRGDGCNGKHLSTQRSVFSFYDYILLQMIIQLVLR